MGIHLCSVSIYDILSAIETNEVARTRTNIRGNNNSLYNKFFSWKATSINEMLRDEIRKLEEVSQYR